MASNPSKTDAPHVSHVARTSKDGSIDFKDEKHMENCEVENGAAPREWLERYPLIKDKTPEQLKALEKSLVRKLDWKFLPMVSIMLIMK
jgi:hypothetical protein